VKAVVPVLSLPQACTRALTFSASPAVGPPLVQVLGLETAPPVSVQVPVGKLAFEKTVWTVFPVERPYEKSAVS
jgi:hypothetical protein